MIFCRGVPTLVAATISGLLVLRVVPSTTPAMRPASTELPSLLVFNDIFALLFVRSRSCRLSHPHASILTWNTGIDLEDNSSETSRD